MLAVAYDYNSIASASGLPYALFGMESRENARFSGFSGGFCPTFTDGVCIKDSVRIDPACGTGGMLSVAEDYLHELNAATELLAFGQELNDQTFAICKADMLIKGNDANFIKDGNTLSDDQFEGQKFDYLISNPPFGREWKNEKEKVEKEAKKGFAGRFGAGLPASSDGQMLFLLNCIAKMKEPKDGGSRIAIIHNGSPLFTGDAGSGPSEIRRYIFENDLLEAIIALPNDIFVSDE